MFLGTSDTLKRGNTGAGMLAQMINYAGISVQLINCSGPCEVYTLCNNTCRLSEIPLGAAATGGHKVCPLCSLLPKWVPGLTQSCLRNCLPFPALPASPRYAFLTSRGKQEGSRIRGLLYMWYVMKTLKNISCHINMKIIGWSHDASRVARPLKHDFSLQDFGVY